MLDKKDELCINDSNRDVDFSKDELLLTLPFLEKQRAAEGIIPTPPIPGAPQPPPPAALPGQHPLSNPVPVLIDINKLKKDIEEQVKTTLTEKLRKEIREELTAEITKEVEEKQYIDSLLDDNKLLEENYIIPKTPPQEKQDIVSKIVEIKSILKKYKKRLQEPLRQPLPTPTSSPIPNPPSPPSTQTAPASPELPDPIRPTSPEVIFVETIAPTVPVQLKKSPKKQTRNKTPTVDRKDIDSIHLDFSETTKKAIEAALFNILSQSNNPQKYLCLPPINFPHFKKNDDAEIFKHEHTFFPVFVRHPDHWMLIHFNRNQKTLTIYDPQPRQKYPTHDIRNTLKTWLMKEARKENNPIFNITYGIPKALPEQPDNTDNNSGLYIIEYARSLILKESCSITYDTIPLYREYWKKKIMHYTSTIQELFGDE